ncbi:MAG: AGE family epimerase/isomerase [Pseudomonadota bacterium]
MKQTVADQHYPSVTRDAGPLGDWLGMTRSWMADSARLWAERGVHPDGGFREELALDGTPFAEEKTSRVRVQARQTFSFALFQELAPELDSIDADRMAALTRLGLDILFTSARRADGLYGRQLQHGGGLVDETADLYDNAFVLLALSKAAAMGHEGAGAAADTLSEAIDAHFRRPDRDGGYFEVLPSSNVRLQNPHMHLLEASLFHHGVTGHAGSAERAERLEQLVDERFVSVDGGLREISREGWRPLEGDRYETGHQYEWVWLLHEKARSLGGPVHGAAQSFYGTAIRLTGDNGEVFLEHHLSGSLKDSTRRCWGITEAIKAHLARLEAGDAEAEARASAAVKQLFETFLAPAPVQGGWIDKYDGYGNPISLVMPASTGYHVYLALAELLRVAGSRA